MAALVAWLVGALGPTGAVAALYLAGALTGRRVLATLRNLLREPEAARPN